MKKSLVSLSHAIHGLTHAIKTERNLRFFVIGHLVLLLLALALKVDLFSMLASTFAAGLFVTVELLNTAIERLADTVDDCEKKRNAGHYHHGIKLTKDVGSAASLIMLILYVCCIALIAVPYTLYFLSGQA
ncbi:hypothetical protein EXS65_00855 [Candidatus Peribacteria bacterium]|nr:hypothetical protein [Candidatus Peribacteria bacterium]